MTFINIPKRVQILRQKFSNSLGLLFQELLPESIIQEVSNAEKITYRSSDKQVMMHCSDGQNTKLHQCDFLTTWKKTMFSAPSEILEVLRVLLNRSM